MNDAFDNLDSRRDTLGAYGEATDGPEQPDLLEPAMTGKQPPWSFSALATMVSAEV
jgi:hypothetical protein